MKTRIEQTELIAGDLLLRRPDPIEDAADALDMLLDPDVIQWNPAPVVDLATAVGWCTRGADWSGGDHATFSVIRAAGGAGVGRGARVSEDAAHRTGRRLVGNISLHRIDWLQRNAEVGYRVAPWARGHGVATESLRAVTTWAFQILGIARIQLFHAVANPASCRVALKVGYRLEGTLRSASVYGDGRRYDDHLHARLSTDPPT